MSTVIYLFTTMLKYVQTTLNELFSFSFIKLLIYNNTQKIIYLELLFVKNYEFINI